MENIQVTNTELGEYFGLTEGAIRALKRKDDPKKYKAMLEAYLEYLATDSLSEDPFVIMLYGFKGGIGKSALARIVNENLSKSNSIIFNLDASRDVKNYTNLEAINFSEIVAEEPNETVDHFIDVLKEVADFIIIDTPGEISNEDTLSAIKKVDLFILPFGIDQEEIDQVVMTATSTLLSNIEYNKEDIYPQNKPLNMLFVLNNYKDDSDIKYIDEVKEKIEEEIEDTDCEYPKINISYTKLKYSKAITTMNRSKKTLKSLGTENFIAYRVARERIKAFMKDVKKAIKTAKGEQ